MRYAKPLLVLAAVLFLGYFSIEIQPLDEVKKAAKPKFDASGFAKKYLSQTLPAAYGSAMPVADLLAALETEREKTFETRSHAVAIGNLRYFLVSGEGTVEQISEDEVTLSVPCGNKTLHLRIATEYVYGNAIRDAAGLFDPKQFDNSADMNNAAAEINKIVRTEVVPGFRRQVSAGKMVRFVGAVELHREHPRLEGAEVFPVKLEVVGSRSIQGR